MTLCHISPSASNRHTSRNFRTSLNNVLKESHPPLPVRRRRGLQASAAATLSFKENRPVKIEGEDLS